jgi:hypothetical protein
LIKFFFLLLILRLLLFSLFFCLFFHHLLNLKRRSFIPIHFFNFHFLLLILYRSC